VHNDGLLINYIARKENITYVAAKQKVAEFVRLTNNKLRKNETVVFEQIGTFNFDKQRNLQFECDATTNYLLDSYGFSSFQFPAVSREYFSNRSSQPLVSRESIHKLAKHKVTRGVLIGLPLIAALYFSPLSSVIFNHSKTSTASMNPVDSLPVAKFLEAKTFNATKLTSEAKPESTKTQTVENQQVLISTNKPKAQETSPKVVSETKISKSTHYLIAGSFKSMENAEKLRKELAGEGFPAEIFELNGQFKVSINSFASLELANKELDRLKSEKNKANIWVLNLKK